LQIADCKLSIVDWGFADWGFADWGWDYGLFDWGLIADCRLLDVDYGLRIGDWDGR
jgi:hypothetical protein